MTRDEIRQLLTDTPAVIATLSGEAANEPIQGIVGVACAIRNRVHADLGHDGKPDWWGDTFAAVCLKKWQFSCWWETNANTDRTYAVAEALMRGQPIGSNNLLSELLWVAVGVIEDKLRDITNGADHYCTQQMYRTKPPSWARNQRPVASLGNHIFFRLN